jgi:hypothetical protein
LGRLPAGPIDIEGVHSNDGGGSWEPFINPANNVTLPRQAAASTTCGRPALNANIREIAMPQIAVGPDSCLHVVYSYDPDGYDTGDVVNVYYRRSCDQGVTWGTEVNLSDDGTQTDQWRPTISVGAENIVVATWYDRRLDTAGNRLFDHYKAESFDGGLTWQSNTRLSDVSSDVPTLAPNFDPFVVSCYFGDYDQQVQWNGAAYLQWSDARNLQNAHPDPDVWFERQPTNGVLNGTVTDAANWPIAGALVEAVGFGTIQRIPTPAGLIR